MSVKIYIEGGGNNNQRLRTELRKSFQHIFINAGLNGRLPHVVASGSRDAAYSDFKTALRQNKSGDTILLLVDSEDPICEITKWAHVKKRDSWEKPADADEDNLFFMVACMESWFFADQNVLKEFFGQHINMNALPKTTNYESIPKSSIFKALEDATRKTQKGVYGKGSHSFKILALLDVKKIETHGSHASDFFKKLRKFTS